MWLWSSIKCLPFPCLPFSLGDVQSIVGWSVPFQHCETEDMLEEMVYMIPMKWFFDFCLKRKRVCSQSIELWRLLDHIFFSLNQECLRGSAMTLDFSESVQSFSWEAWGKMVDYCTFSLKWGWHPPTPNLLYPEDINVQLLRHVNQVVTTSIGGRCSKLIV